MEWLDATHLRYSDTSLKPCWWRHPDVLWHLTALKDAYDSAYTMRIPDTAPIAWHLHWLWPTMERINTMRSMQKCKTGVHTPAPSPLLDHDHAIDETIAHWMTSDPTSVLELAEPDDA
ncbi:DUF4913 domain-containing protein [Demequina litorisediminis]|uniref:DUF3291 domain-containing protein n=1 Tax=Demequina litorisediminis TaxID=1849022 RepID=A0ABQ6IJ13_9MICO|nr:hypothetical protein [Demequina litorisediminis]GMA37820.1 hypothetical protein GCM10025876_40240 [Demequina litorisediminis]GMA37915.1 hypothetical protein GCM10025876_41190 [Demequina litorisediminis]